MKWRRGFTLVELLAVIGIIAVLVSVLLPAIIRARDAGITVQCAAQMRHMGIATANYAAENSGYLYPTSWPDQPNPGEPRCHAAQHRNARHAHPAPVPATPAGR